jgi:hypothetical protein
MSWREDVLFFLSFTECGDVVRYETEAALQS